MKRIALYAGCLLALMAGNLSAGEVKEIELTDGSILTGEVLSLHNGVYTVRTESLGTVTVNDARVRTTRSRSAAPAASGTADQVRSLQERMLSDQEIMAMIETLKDDPDFRKVLEDPAVMDAVAAGDVAGLMANPAFLQLMNNSMVGNIRQKMGK